MRNGVFGKGGDYTCGKVATRRLSFNFNEAPVQLPREEGLIHYFNEVILWKGLEYILICTSSS